MIKKTLYFGNPAYLSLRNAQLVIKLPEVENNATLPEVMKRQSEVTKPIEDLGVVVLDNKQITITSGAMEALLENNCALITCDSKSMPVGLMLPLCGNTTQNERFREQLAAIVATNHSNENQQSSCRVVHLYERGVEMYACLGKRCP